MHKYPTSHSHALLLPPMQNTSEKSSPPPLGAAPPQIPGQYLQYPQPQHYPGQQQPPQYANAQPAQYAQPVQYQQAPHPQYAPQPQPPPQVAQGAYPPQQTYPAQQIYPAQQPYVAVVMQQPLPVIGMTIPTAGGNRNVKNLPRNHAGKREWSFGFCDCFADCGTCMFAWCCPCMLYAQLKQRLDYVNTYARPDPSRGGSGIDVNCMVWCLIHAVTGCGFVLQTMNRGQIRNRYVIDGDGCGDFFAAWCCHPCELTQEHRELDLEEQTLRQ